ncbi:MAG: NCS2 family permease [Candidatus Omnitrophota bacterium]
MGKTMEGKPVLNRQTFIQTFFTRNGSEKPSVSTEVIAGVTTFLTMAYIIFVNPTILASTGMDKTALTGVTCLVSGIVTILTGLVANAPIAMAPGMGLNAYFAYILVANQHVPWPVALGIVFLSGLVFLLLTWAGFRTKLVEAIPHDLLNAIAVGIGVFIAFIGLQNMGLVIKNDVTFVSGGPLNRHVLIGLAGLLCMILLEIKKVKGSMLIGIGLATVLSLMVGDIVFPVLIFPFKFSLSPVFGKIDILGALKVSFLAPIFTLMFMDLFDSIGSLLGLAKEANMVDSNGKIPKLSTLLSLDAFASMFGAVCGTSTTTAYIESASGIESGGRTGLTSVVTGILFLLALMFVPVFAIVPANATAPALLMVGFFMMGNIKAIDFKNPEIGFPSFLIIILIALCYSISTGLAFGFLSYTLIKVFRGKVKEISPVLWLINMLCLLFFVV